MNDKNNSCILCNEQKTAYTLFFIRQLNLNAITFMWWTHTAFYYYCLMYVFILECC